LLYGMTTSGGITTNQGTIFSYDISNGVETVLYSFSGGSIDGGTPYGSLIQASDGLLYGMTQQGGNNGNGVIFNYNINTGIEKDIHDFGTANDGQYPYGSLMQAGNGLLYGMTEKGGIYNEGAIISYNGTSGTEKDIYDFKRTNGSFPLGDLIEIGSTATDVNQVDYRNYYVSIFPNPGSGLITIASPATMNKITVTDLLGHLIYTSDLRQNKTLLNFNKTGVYFITIVSGNKTVENKIVITK
jgi:uncharacterized repeat protein (TIGR03803 family)